MKYRKTFQLIYRCKDCLDQCELYQSSIGGIPDECPLEIVEVNETTIDRTLENEPENEKQIRGIENESN